MSEKEIIHVNGLREDLYQAMQIGSITLKPDVSGDLYNFMNYQDKKIEELQERNNKALELLEDWNYLDKLDCYREPREVIDILRGVKE